MQSAGSWHVNSSTNDPTVLIADDNPTNRRVLAASLQKAGYRTLEAEDGTEALRIALERTLDLLLLDVSMPGLDGFDVCSEIKATPRTADIPVIFITSLSDPGDIERAFAVGGCDYVTKPFHLSEVKARAAVHLSLRRANLELRETHARLLQTSKLESIGQLAAGIAHEINTPAQFVCDNLRFLESTYAQLPSMLRQVRGLCDALREGKPSEERLVDVANLLQETDVEFLETETPRAISESLEGLERITSIVRAMKEFSHPSAREAVPFDLNRAVATAVTMSTSEWKIVADVETDLDPSLPPVSCVPGEIHQVLLNLIVNASHAIGECPGSRRSHKGTIRISTRLDGRFAEIRVADTGAGIPATVRDRVFDPFFTTKEVGKGTGQGLSLAHAVVVKQHGGALSFDSEVGRGTTFLVRLPLSGKDSLGSERAA